MSEAWSVEAELEQVQELLEQFQQLAPARGTGAWHSFESLRDRQLVLLREKAAKGAAALELTINGGPVDGHTVAAAFAGQLLERVQSLVTSVAQALEDEVTLRAPVPHAIADRVALRLTATAPGSFRLLLNPPYEPQEALPGFEEMTLVDASIEAVLDVIDAAVEDEPDASRLLERTTRLGGRARSHLQRLSALLVGADARLGLQHVRDGDAQTVRTTHLDPARAQRIESVLSGAREHRETVRRTGRLVGTSWHTETFDLEAAADDGTREVVHGRVEPALRDEVSRAFDHEITAVLERRVLVADTGEETTAYRLVGLAE